MADKKKAKKAKKKVTKKAKKKVTKKAKKKPLAHFSIENLTREKSKKKVKVKVKESLPLFAADNKSEKKAGTKKAVTKKAVAKKAVTKKAVTKKAVTKKAVTKKAVTKKAVTKKASVHSKRAKKLVPKVEKPKVKVPYARGKEIIADKAKVKKAVQNVVTNKDITPKEGRTAQPVANKSPRVKGSPKLKVVKNEKSLKEKLKGVVSPSKVKNKVGGVGKTIGKVGKAVKPKIKSVRSAVATAAVGAGKKVVDTGKKIIKKGGKLVKGSKKNVPVKGAGRVPKKKITGSGGGRVGNLTKLGPTLFTLETDKEKILKNHDEYLKDIKKRVGKKNYKHGFKDKTLKDDITKPDSKKYGRGKGTAPKKSSIKAKPKKITASQANKARPKKQGSYEGAYKNKKGFWKGENKAGQYVNVGSKVTDDLIYKAHVAKRDLKSLDQPYKDKRISVGNYTYTPKYWKAVLKSRFKNVNAYRKFIREMDNKASIKDAKSNLKKLGKKKKALKRKYNIRY